MLAHDKGDTSMNESLPKTNAVVYKDGIPKWDVAADEVAYVFTHTEKGTDYLFVPVLRQHTDPQSKKGFSYANKTALREATPAMKMSGDEFELPIADERPYEQFVDEHFVRIVGTSVEDPATHKAWLNERPHMKVRIFKEGVQGISREVSEDEGVGADIFDIMAAVTTSDEREIELFQELFSVEKGKKERLVMVHKLKEASEKEYQSWRKSSTRKFNPRKRKFIAKENYDVLEKIYDDLVNSIEGMVINSKSCHLDNKGEWVGLVPLEHKLLVLDAVFSDYAGKNL